MYIEKEKQLNTEKELTIDFGKNGLGLNDEIVKIGKRIEELSINNTIYLRDAFIDELDDVYQLKFVLFKKEKK